MTMKFEQKLVDPATAAAWLATSPGNRQIRPSLVGALVRAIQHGEWRQTHQAIAFDEMGRLLDGHHRLTAIQRAGIPCLVMVVFGAPRETYSVLDCGAPRSIADRTHYLGRITDALSLAGRILFSNRPSATEIVVIHDTGLGGCLRDLVDYCGSVAKGVTSAPIKLAAGMKLLTNPAGRPAILASYRRLATRNFREATNAELGLIRTAMDGRVSAVNTYDMLARGLRVFDDSRGELKILKIHAGGENSAVVWVRETLRARLDRPEAAQ